MYRKSTFGSAAEICLHAASTAESSEASASRNTILQLGLRFSRFARWPAKRADDLPRTQNVGACSIDTIFASVAAPIPFVAPAKTPTTPAWCSLAKRALLCRVVLMLTMLYHNLKGGSAPSFQEHDDRYIGGLGVRP